MSELAGLTLIYGLPAGFGYVFWVLLVKPLVAHWTHRDLMLSLIPEARHVHHTERILRVIK